MPGAVPCTELCNHGIVIGGDRVTHVDTAVDPDARSARGTVPDNFSRIGREVIQGVFCIDPALDRMTADGEILLLKGKGLTGSNRNLLS